MARLAKRAIALVALTLMLALAGCGEDSEPSAPSPSAGATATETDLSAIACATEVPADVGELTGAWTGNDNGVYYIRQVGDCVWWFGTEIEDIEPGQIAQPGFANVASGRIVGTRIDVEWADLPMGNILGGGGLTFVYDEENDQLVMTEQRGEWQPFGGSTLTRIEASAGPDASPSESASP
jgi:hypothetical protein